MKLQYYQDRKKEWRWRLEARNGRIVADCGEGYKRRIDCMRGFEAMCVGVAKADKIKVIMI